MISVCIASYNGEKFIKKQLESILPQLRESDEVIISDDSSTDNTVAIVQSFNDKRIILIRNQKFKSPIFNFENAIKNANGNYIFLSDQDDIWVAGKVEAFMKEFENYDVIVSDHSLFKNDNEVIYKSFFSFVYSKPGLFHNLKKNTYFGCCMAFKKILLTKAVPFPKDIPMHDIWLGFVADIYFKSKFLDYPYTLYRKHDDNFSNTSDIVSENSILTKVKNRINLVKYLPQLLIR